MVEGAERISVSLIGSSVSIDAECARYIDVENDLVVLEVPDSNAPALRIQPSKDLAIGVDVFAIGNPLGLEGTISQGIVSGFRDMGSTKLLQTTAPISPGNSGGPLVDASGMVCGVVVASMKKGQNLNFAVPSEALTKLLNAAPQSLRIQEIPRIRHEDKKD